MTNQQHPVTPPPELVQKWALEKGYDERDWLYELHIANRAAQWGADQELEACAEWVGRMFHGHKTWSDELRAARRPEPQTLNSIALEMLGTIEKMDVVVPEITDTIRRALKELTK